jgi:hypothetical protein
VTFLTDGADAMVVEEEEGEGDEDDLQEPPSLTVANVASVIRRKGYIGALMDEGMGPHIHLLTILGGVVLIAIVVAIVGLS